MVKRGWEISGYSLSGLEMRWAAIWTVYMANCHLSSDWQFKQSVAVALPAVILKAGGLRGWAARFLPGRVAG